MTQERLETIAALFANEEIAREIIATDNAQDAIAIFAANGVSVTEGELDEISASLAAQSLDGELNEAQLEGVSGGSFSLGAIGGWILATAATALAKEIVMAIGRWGIRYAEKKFGRDLNGDGKLG